MALRFILVDVFTERPFGGNQLAVFPDTEDIEPRQMQEIARELNLPETTFVLPPQRAESFRTLRIFTPEAEIPFAGHPIVGAVYALESEGLLGREQDDFVLDLETGAIPVSVQREESGGALQSVVMTQQRPVFLGQYHRQDCVAEALGLHPSDLAITGLPCEVVSTGLPVHIVPVGSLDAVRHISLHPEKLAEIQKGLGFSDLFVFTFETEQEDATVHCRMFAPSFGIPEDPASGSASGSLGAYLVKHRAVHVTPTTRIVTEQGFEIHRPGHVLVEIQSRGGAIESVRVGGKAVVVGEGRLYPSALG
jgi:trans-2,3-dihydro-3-hydroxyanthranilate isomerase